MGIAEAKAALRAKMSAFRNRPEERSAASEDIRDRLVGLDSWRSARTVLLYAPLPDEPNVFLLPRDGKSFCYPRYHADRGYEAAQVDDPAELAPGKFGILEPLPESPGVSPGEVDLIVLPGVAFDEECFRLGRGRGFYDRWLLALSGLKVGVGFDHQLIEQVPRELHDVQLDGVLVPSRRVGQI